MREVKFLKRWFGTKQLPEIKVEVAPSITTEHAVDTLKHALEFEPGYRESWIANIAMAFKDEAYRHRKKTGKPYLSSADVHEIANKAAEEFITRLCQ